MIFVTGDYHGGMEQGKLASRNFPQGRSLTRNDYLIVCGDFGLPWQGTPEERYNLDWLASKPWTTLFVDGNHENFDLLQSCGVARWKGGEVHVMPSHPGILHLMRGQVFDIDGVRVFTMGGASSTDRWWREEGVSWFPQELPNLLEYETARMNLDRAGWQVDYVVTHTIGTQSLARALGPGADPGRLACDPLTDFLQEVDERLDYRQWYFGHFHRDCSIDGRHTLLYQKVIPLGADLGPAGP